MRFFFAHPTATKRARKAHIALRLTGTRSLECLRARLIADDVKSDDSAPDVPGVARFFAEDPREIAWS